ncbi:4-hydroxyphenylacetate isomerase [Marinobacter halodurans]|uniref:4-hydroxyphenylacetate isomerase n=1 Tax=Marinobacter halodurans TaxID=2528979 RepID=A0ABY1ZSU2_9GAMM|nr:fumarylacetoacetate hydrolase family protein [Marinobacter halodurans]TBW59537.1 4-hydroxyphenylacetate isomerase [Marinobacter halodurans]
MPRPIEEVATGSIFGVALNYRSLLDSRLDEFRQAPYKTPPNKPVLFIKTENTRNGNERPMVFPAGVERIQPGPAVGVVIGRKASRVRPEDAMDYVAGYTIVNEFSLPEESYYRPAVKAKCRDGFCPMGPDLVEADAIADPGNLSIQLRVNGDVRQEGHTSDWVRTIPELIGELTEFMTLNEGDVLITGTPAGRVDVKVGDRVEVEISGLGRLVNTITAEH